MVATFLAVANNSASTLAKAATAAATEVELIAGGHTSFPAAVPFDVSIDNEILHVTKVTGDVFTVTRAAQGTTAAEHLTGAQCQLNVTAKSLTDLNEAVNAVEEAMVTKGGLPQTITSEKKFTTTVVFTKVEAEAVTLYGLKSLAGVSTLAVGGGTFSLTEELTLLGTPVAATLKQVKITGKNENYEGFTAAPQDTAYAVIPEGGAAEVTSIVAGGNKHRLICLVNATTNETLTLVHEGAATSATSKMHFASGENIKLGPEQVLWLWYTEGTSTGTKERWRDVGGASLNFRAKQATIANPIEELKSVREKLEAVIAAIKKWQIIE